MLLLYASHQSAGKLSVVSEAPHNEENDPLWLNTRTDALVRHYSLANLRENFAEHFV